MNSFADPLPLPVWAALHRLPEAAPLDADTNADVCVIGAGVAGLTTALLLARAGANVVVLEAGRPGGGESARFPAHLSTAMNHREGRVESRLGRPGAMLVAQSHRAAIGRVEGFVEEFGLACDYRRLNGYLFASDPGDAWTLDEELQASHAAGLIDTELCDWPGGGAPRCLRFPRQAQISPWPYLRGLGEEIGRRRGRIHGGTRVVSIKEGREAVVCAANGRRVRADAVVLATNTPLNEHFALPGAFTTPRVRMVALPIAAGTVPAGLYRDTAAPGRHARLTPSSRPGEEFLIVGGEIDPSDPGESSARGIEPLIAWAHRWFSHHARLGSPSYRWESRVPETTDGLGLLGRHPGESDNIYVAAGGSGMGLTHGTLAGMILSDLIRRRPNPWRHLYDPARLATEVAASREEDPALSGYACAAPLV